LRTLRLADTRASCDASVAVIWLVEEASSPQALALLKHGLLAPDLLIAECANIIWKKHRLGEMTVREALLAAVCWSVRRST